MLRIQASPLTAHVTILLLQGHIVAGWVDLLEDECLGLIASGLDVVLDFSGVVFISHSGLEAIGRLNRAGARITGCPPLIADVLEQEGIEVDRDVAITAEGRGPRNKKPNLVSSNQGSLN